MTKFLHFNLSGNHLFKDEEPDIIIRDLGRCMEEEDIPEKESNVEEYAYNHTTTLRDICVLLYIACGQGIMWNFSREMAAELKLDKTLIEIALENIVNKYANMTEEEARKKYDELAVYIEVPYFSRRKNE